MNENLLKLVIVPIFVGLIMATFQLVIPTLLEKDLELSYFIEGPKTYIDKGTIGDVKLEINDIETPYLVSQSVRIWNSGELPIKALPVTYIFENSSSNFKIFAVKHNTKPEYEFGNISTLKADQNSIRNLYELLNPNDEITVTFLTNERVSLSIYTKAEGLSISKYKPVEGIPPIYGWLISTISALLAIIFTILSPGGPRKLMYIIKKI